MKFKEISTSNSTPASPCKHSNLWIQEDSPWLLRNDFNSSHITAQGLTDEDPNNLNCAKEDEPKPLREKNSKYIHVPHRDKPPQVVAKRNARERRRVQAVNSAFIRLKKAVPLENSRGKRVSKVRTLHYAIEYIHQLEELLRKDGSYRSFNVLPTFCYSQCDDFMDAMEFKDEF